MYVGRQFDPSDTEESEVYSFDFVNDLLDPGEILVSATFDLAVARSSPVDDPAVATKLLGTAAVSGSPVTIASQRVANLVQRAVYYIQAKVVTSTGNVRSLSSYIRVEDQH